MGSGVRFCAGIALVSSENLARNGRLVCKSMQLLLDCGAL